MDGVRRPEAFQAVIGGQADSAVAAERHFSPAKVDTLITVNPGLAVQIALLQTQKLSQLESHISLIHHKMQNVSL